MVGDTPFDLEMAQRAGVPGVAVGHGFYDRDALLACEPGPMLRMFRPSGTSSSPW